MQNGCDVGVSHDAVALGVDAAQAGTETTVDPLLNPPVSWLATIVSDDTEIQSQWTSISP
jgi:hypothetical protein